MNSVRKGLQTHFLNKVKNYSFVSGDKDAFFSIEAEDSYDRDMIYATRKLNNLNALTTEEKIDSVRSIGIVSWTGGSQALQNAASQINLLLNMFQIECYEVKIEIVKTLAQICSLNEEYQNTVREGGYLEQMINFLIKHEPDQTELQRWMIYAIIHMTTDNVKSQKFVLSFPNFKAAMDSYQTEVWDAWRKNEATYLYNLLGYSQG